MGDALAAGATIGGRCTAGDILDLNPPVIPSAARLLQLRCSQPKLLISVLKSARIQPTASAIDRVQKEPISLGVERLAGDRLRDALYSNKNVEPEVVWLA